MHLSFLPVLADPLVCAVDETIMASPFDIDSTPGAAPPKVLNPCALVTLLLTGLVCWRLVHLLLHACQLERHGAGVPAVID